MTPLYCGTQNMFGGKCGKNGVAVCLNDVREMIKAHTGKPVPSHQQIKCERCIDEPHKK
ncbi:unnamed protein product, partial [Eruca vesicaria subsp. sativa]|nr:unnamed protein product [Eruca vesicaria subsp. sativa]